MGMDAEIIVIGPLEVLDKVDCLEYGRQNYDWDTPKDKIICRLAGADTTSQSTDLAQLCGLGPWDLNHHQIKRLEYFTDFEELDPIGGKDPIAIFENIKYLLEHGCDIWFMPNG